MDNANHKNPLITTLLHSDVYPHAVGDIRLLETHISWVYLTGDYTYKVKKPIRLGFLDFSTQELRRHFCEEELRLNRRFSVDMYLDVVSINQIGERTQIAEEETEHTIEYAVRMRQFAQNDLAIEMLKSDRLTHRELISFAESLSRFHRQALLAPIHRDNPVEAVRGPALVNFQHLDGVELDDVTRKSVPQLHRWTASTCRDLAETFSARSKHGYVCDCHGDLHLGNIVRWNDKLTPFDCIEFNSEFRQIDVISEIAFLVMDLDDHQRPDLAASFLNTYLEQTGDYAGLRVLPFFLVYRSMIRAKVNAIRIQQGHLTRAERNELTQECLSYIRLATTYSEKKSPILAITCGLSGSGKTTGSESLIRDEGFVRIRSDVERKRLFGLGPLDRAKDGIASGIYTEDANTRTEERLLTAATDALQAGFSVIVDATFIRRSQRRPFMQLAKDAGVPFKIYHFEADNDVLRERIHKRQQSNADASDASVDVLEHQIEIQEPFANEETEYVIKMAPISEQTAESLLPAQ